MTSPSFGKRNFTTSSVYTPTPPLPTLQHEGLTDIFGVYTNITFANTL
jgi:hypothetical protein